MLMENLQLPWVLILFFASFCSCHDYNKQYKGVTVPKEPTQYNFTIDQGDVVSIRFSSTNATENFPLLISMVNDFNVISAKVPLRIGNFYYMNITRTFCPYPEVVSNRTFGSIVLVTLTSRLPVHFELRAVLVQRIAITVGVPLKASVTTAADRFYEYTFPRDVYKVQINVDSAGRAPCMRVTPYRNWCPVFHIRKDIPSRNGFTVTSSGTITLNNEDGEVHTYFLLFSILPNDDECNGIETKEEPHPAKGPIRTKKFHITALVVDDHVLLKPILITGGIIGFVVLLLSASCIFYERLRHKEFDDRMDEDEQKAAAAAENPLIALHDEEDNDVDLLGGTGNALVGNESFEPDTQHLEEAGQIATEVAVLTVADTSTKCYLARDRDLNFYFWNAFTFLISYGLPAGQLLLRWVTRTHENIEECYFNFRCAHYAFGLNAFNNVFSNIGYLGAGATLLILSKVRHHNHLKRSKNWMRRQRAAETDVAVTQEPADTESYPAWGIPHHGGLMNAIALCIIAEGVLSACYHICPSPYNYQFDMTFMYLICMLTMLQIYQNRHQDNTPTASLSLVLLSVIVVFACLGIYLQKEAGVWMLFYAIHFCSMLIFAFEFYTKDRWSVEEFSPAGAKRMMSKIHRAVTQEKLRSASFVFVILANIMLILYAELKHRANFPLFQLSIFIANLVIYLIYYISMKVVNERRFWKKKHLPFVALAAALLLLSIICFTKALSYFTDSVSEWSETPAHSREHNRECIALSFYDNHDMWHFWSAAGLLFGLIFVMIIDDGVGTVPRNELRVF